MYNFAVCSERGDIEKELEVQKKKARKEKEWNEIMSELTSQEVSDIITMWIEM